MRLPEAIKVLRANTMACWWPESGMSGTDLAGVFWEARLLTGEIKRRQDIPPNTPFFVLDDDNPETALYNELVSAVLTVRQCMAVS